eukprot:SAG31_NODE_2084_length_6489_cov_7.773239_6_plen_49_part_00
MAKLFTSQRQYVGNALSPRVVQECSSDRSLSWKGVRMADDPIADSKSL